MLDESEVLSAAYRVVIDTFVGLMTTVDSAGRPHSRYMAAAPAAENLDRLLAVSAKSGRKLDHLAENANVCWVFSDPRHHEVVTLNGVAREMRSQALAEPVWERLTEATRKYSMNVLSEPENLWFAAIETLVESVEYLCPDMDLTSPIAIQLAPPLR